MGTYLNKLKEKCNINDSLFKKIEDIFQKLLHFGYITTSQVKTLEKRLYHNIDTVFYGDDIQIDYKTGYYDCINKELYIKDETNLEAIYLRVLYALTTTQISKTSYYIGFSKVHMSKSSYAITYENYGMNRAITSNLVCRLLNTDPTALSIIPTYKTYENDFIGNKIKADNDIYFIEAKLLNQLYYLFHMNMENLYVDIFFKNKKNYFERLFEKIKFKKIEQITSLFDTISLTYSNYNKLAYLNKLLNDNYLSIKRRIPGSNIEDLDKQKDKIILQIQNSLEKIIPSEDETDDDVLQPNIESRLSEQLLNLENKILYELSEFQKLEADFLIEHAETENTFTYAVKLKKLQEISILENKELTDYLFHLITEKLMYRYEKDTSSNIEKIKYSMINEILKNEKYSKMYEGLRIYKLPTLKFEEETEIVVLAIDQTFIQFIQIDHLFEPIHTLTNNAQNINIDNMEHLLNNKTINKDIPTCERIYASLKTKYPDLSNTKLKDIYIANLQNHCVVLIPKNNNFTLIEFNLATPTITSKKLKLSDPYQLFNPKNFSNIPTLYKKRKEKHSEKEELTVKEIKK